LNLIKLRVSLINVTGRTGTTELSGGGGSSQRSSPTCGAPAATEGYGLRNCVQKVWGKRVGAHRGTNRAEASDRVVATKLGGGARSESGKELAVRVALDSSGLLGGMNCDQMALRSRAKGQGGLRTTGGEELRRRRDLPPTGLG